MLPLATLMTAKTETAMTVSMILLIMGAILGILARMINCYFRSPSDDVIV